MIILSRLRHTLPFVVGKNAAFLCCGWESSGSEWLVVMEWEPALLYKWIISVLFHLLLQSQLHLHCTHANLVILASEGAQGHLSSFKASAGLNELLWKLGIGSPWRTGRSPQKYGSPSRTLVCVRACINGITSQFLPWDVNLLPECFTR